MDQEPVSYTHLDVYKRQEDEILTYMLTILEEKGIYDGSVKELL